MGELVRDDLLLIDSGAVVERAGDDDQPLRADRVDALRSARDRHLRSSAPSGHSRASVRDVRARGPRRRRGRRPRGNGARETVERLAEPRVAGLERVRGRGQALRDPDHEMRRALAAIVVDLPRLGGASAERLLVAPAAALCGDDDDDGSARTRTRP